MTTSQAGSSDLFFFYDSVPVSDMIAADVFSVIQQEPGRMYYNRRWGCDMAMQEGAPNTLSQQVTMRVGIISALSLRNSRVTDGRGAYPDRRAVTSFNAIDFISSGLGSVNQAGQDLDIQVQYIETGDLTQMKKATIPGAGRAA